MTRLFLHLLIALRNIRRNLRRSAFTVLAVAFGVFCLILFLALKEGLHRQMVDGTISLDAASVQIHASEHRDNTFQLAALAEPDRLLAILARLGLKAAPRLKLPALLMLDNRVVSVVLSGVEPEAERQVTAIAAKVVAGGYLQEPSSLLMGQALANQLQVGVGEKVRLLTQDSGGSQTVRAFTVGGLYATGHTSFDQGRVYLQLDRLRAFLDAEGAANEIAVAAPAISAQATAEAIGAAIGPGGYRVEAWPERLPDLRQLLELNDATMHLLVVILFAIVALGIMNTMNTIVFERFREIGVMTAIGATPANIMAMILLESLLLGLFAMAIGNAAGLALGYRLSVAGIDLGRFISSNQYLATTPVLRAVLTASDLLGANLTALLTALLAGLYPAWRAARLDPVQALGQG